MWCAASLDMKEDDPLILNRDNDPWVVMPNDDPARVESNSCLSFNDFFPPALLNECAPFEHHNDHQSSSSAPISNYNGGGGHQSISVSPQSSIVQSTSIANTIGSYIDSQIAATIDCMTPQKQGVRNPIDNNASMVVVGNTLQQHFKPIAAKPARGGQLKSNSANDNKNFSCDQCSAKFTRSESLRRHFLNKHMAPKFCAFPGCSYSTRNAKVLQIHKRYHHRASIYFCKQCKIKFERRQSLLHHLTHKHGSNVALIGMIAQPQNQFITEEEERAVINQEETCDDTEAEDENSKLLEEEDEEETSQDIDQQPCSTNSILLQQKAPPQPSFSCGKCDFVSNTFLEFYKHRQAAHNDLNEQINENNSHDPKSQSSLASAPPRVTCLYCFKKFASSNSLLTHIRKQHLQTSAPKRKKNFYSCERCSFTTTCKKMLKTHEAYCKQGQKTLIVTSSPVNNVHHSLQKSTASATSYNVSPSAKIWQIANEQQNAHFYHQPITNGHHGSNQSINGNAGLSLMNSNTNNRLLAPHLDDMRNDVIATSCSSSYANHNGHQSSGQKNNLLIDDDVEQRHIVTTTKLKLRVAKECTVQDNSTFESMASCVEHLQQANSSLLNLCRKRENELKSLRSNVSELLYRFFPSNEAYLAQKSADQLVDRLVLEALNGNFD